MLLPGSFSGGRALRRRRAVAQARLQLQVLGEIDVHGELARAGGAFFHRHEDATRYITSRLDTVAVVRLAGRARAGAGTAAHREPVEPQRLLNFGERIEAAATATQGSQRRADLHDLQRCQL